MTTDPIVRYAAAGVLLTAFIGCMVVAVHGYWQSATYQLPGIVTLILGGAVSSAATLLGVHIGTIGTQTTAGQTAQLINGAQKTHDAGTGTGSRQQTA